MKTFKNIFILMAALFSSLVNAQNVEKFVSQTNEDFKKTIADKSVQLIDVRTPQEYKEGHIPGAVNIDVNSNEFVKLIQTLSIDKPVAVYCKSGARSKAAANKLVAKGFKVYELDKGFLNWDAQKNIPQ